MTVSDGFMFFRGYDASWQNLPGQVSSDLGQTYMTFAPVIPNNLQRIFKRGNRILFDSYDTSIGSDRMYISTDGGDTLSEIAFPAEYVKSGQVVIFK